MKLIGMLDSPFVRRTAISLHCLGVPFEHVALSVFSNFKELRQINPVVKVPSLVLDTGEVIMDSNCIIAFAEFHRTRPALIPESGPEQVIALQIIGLALAACEKAVQLIYEQNLRPVDLHFEPWLKRVKGQLLAACQGLETLLQANKFTADKVACSQAAITAAVTWQFIFSQRAELFDSEQFPALSLLSATAEQLPEFSLFPPDGPGVVAQH